MLLLGSAGLALCGWFASVRWRPVMPAPSAEFVALAAESDRLRVYTDAELGAWRKKRDELEPQAWTRAALDELATMTGSEWLWEWPTQGSAMLEHVQRPAENWPDYLDLVEAISRKPGIAVNALELRVTGEGRRRQFTKARLELRFLVAATGSPPRSPFPSDPTGSPAGISTKTNPQKDPQ